MHSNNRSQVYVRTSSIFQSINKRHTKCIWLPKLNSSNGGVFEIKITELCYNNSLIDLVMRKLLFFLHMQNKDADQLGSNCAADQRSNCASDQRNNCTADQRICFRYTDSTIHILRTYKILCRTWAKPRPAF